MFLSFCGKAPRNEGAAFVAPNATVQGDVVLSPGSTVWYGAVLRGGGGTEFRPAFEYLTQRCAEKKFSNLRGLLYFTDGMGTYPAKRPAYDTAFLFLGDRFDDANVPPWAMKVVLDEEEFTGTAARPQSALADALAEEDDLYRDLNNS